MPWDVVGIEHGNAEGKIESRWIYGHCSIFYKMNGENWQNDTLQLERNQHNMKGHVPGPQELPSVAQLEEELHRQRHQKRYHQVLLSTVCTLVVVAAAAVLIAVLVLPVLQIYGGSMEPTLKEGDIVVSVKGTEFRSGDLVSFYVGNKLLVKRFIAGPGQWVDIDEDGNVYVDGALLDEPYLTEKALGECNITLPYQVPDGRIFVIGDHRSTSVDSRSTSIGCIADEQIVGKIIFRVWPLGDFGTVK